MSWLDKIKNDLIITCGDGKSYRPNWLNAVKDREYNTAEFDFHGVVGTYVYRGTPRGRKYSLEIYFQGETHLDTATAFETSADDNRAWTLEHPYYGRLLVQPTALRFDNTAHNVTKITGTIIETITEDYPKGRQVPADVIAANVATTDEAAAQAYANNVTPAGPDKNQMRANINAAYTPGSKFVDTANANAYFNAFNEAAAAITTATAEPLAAMRKIQAVINKPAQFQATVQTRMDVLNQTFTSLRAQVANITDRKLKFLYQGNAANVLTGLALTAATPLATDYANRPAVLAVIETIIATYNQYVADLDTLQSTNGGSPDSFVPDAVLLTGLNSLINYTLGNLFNIAANAKQERSFVLENDSNWLLLTHRVYGLDAADANLDKLMNENGAGLATALHVPKNKIIVYYI
jgi:hypothetical protein